jgi:hypothetical protein
MVSKERQEKNVPSVETPTLPARERLPLALLHVESLMKLQFSLWYTLQYRLASLAVSEVHMQRLLYEK